MAKIDDLVKKKVPELRFPGFTDDWEERKLGEHSNILTGGTPKTSMSNYWNPKEIPWMSSGEVNKRRLNETDNMISKEGLENSSARWVK
ncbi:restriction endonuclease subunit S [Leuconostoc falkenbergense]|uniref:Restriction endonuclease subunit S n=1 Tax=Leuconostoc falkenbergense TaxID=2766470 RepID=A0ABT7S1T5_9LACO|nr:restriction endonuclease subunit S [Leuconostoc falkenbergense]MDM7647541.1 restriction endonuclease subunit S [Leuconostoc falkenbergense]